MRADAVPEDEDLVTDTVGAICVDKWGRVAAGSSSGGIGMKFRGRVGPAALIGVGTWIRSDDDGIVVATTCSGTGEQMAHTMIASKAVERMFETDDEFNGLKIAIEHDFMGRSPHPQCAVISAYCSQAPTLYKTPICRQLLESWPSSLTR
jgi:taspase (threonine aspartase 1)